MSRYDGVDGVNAGDWWNRYKQAPPQAPDRVEGQQVLLVDKDGKPLIVKKPRPVGFRKP